MADDFEAFCRFLKTSSGMVLADTKRYLVESKLRPVFAKHSLADLGALVKELTQRPSSPLADEVIQMMTINETYFFRDKTPFDNLRDVILPELHRSRPPGRPIRIWSAASATGQEPYSLAILLDQMRHVLGNRPAEIMATDLSQKVIERAREACYSQFEVQRGLSTPMLLKYFEKVGDKWRLRPALRAAVKFKQINLLSALSGLGTFDVVFCRNVLIYFDASTKAQVLRKIRSVMADDGYLLLGASESVLGLSTDFEADERHKSLLRCAKRPSVAAALDAIAARAPQSTTEQPAGRSRSTGQDCDDAARRMVLAAQVRRSI